MGFSETVHWWQEWQLHILALSSLFFQCFLFMTSFLRKRCISSWVRFFIWLAYLGSDAIALYALAALFNYPRQVSLGVKILWAPILLVHLGGQDCITAYNIEDNELWKRHVLTAMSQVTIAVYVFWKSWSPDKSGYYLEAGILLFLPGILKCILKPFDLKRVSMNSLVSSSGSKVKSTMRWKVGINKPESENIYEPKDFIEKARPRISSEGGQQPTSDGGNEVPLFERPYDLFVDLAPLYSDRLRCLQHFRDNTTDSEITHHTAIQSGLSKTFDRLYTKETFLMRPSTLKKDSYHSILDLCSNFLDLARILAVLCIFPVIVIVPITQEEAMDTDVLITYILLGVTAGLEFLIPLLIFNRFSQVFGKQRWPDQVYQHNLFWYLNKKRRRLRDLVTLLVCKKILDQHWWCLPSSNSASSAAITSLVHEYLKNGWSEITDMDTYRAFNDNRGQWTLKRVNTSSCSKMRRSLERPFDESVILWHLATDFCFHHKPSTTKSLSSQIGCTRSREMSNYMAYLLFVNPEMLMTGARRGLLREAHEQLKEMLLRTESEDDGAGVHSTPQAQERALAIKIGKNCTKTATSSQGRNTVNDAWDLAQELRTLRGEGGDDTVMWKVIRGVWVEMLCFSAGRCRGYLHAKSLGTGGEYLSYVWLLLLYMGMETLGEKMQRTHEETSNGGGAFQAAGGCQTEAPQTSGDAADDTSPQSLRRRAQSEFKNKSL